MPSIEEPLDEVVTPNPTDDEHAVGDVDTDPTEPTTVQESPTRAAARMLELASGTADQLVAEAGREAESLLATARARAEAILESSRTEADRVTAELARSKQEQTAELDRQRATALAGLADETAALEARIATLRQMEADHRSYLRQHLTSQLSLLDAALPEPPAGVAR